jgi:hypothetical protein
VAGDAGRSLKPTTSALAAVAAASVVIAAITLALVTQNRALESAEERLLAMALDAGKQGPEPPIVIDWFDKSPSHGDIAREVDRLIKADVAAVGVLIPLDKAGISAGSADEQQLSVALQGAKKAAVMVRLENGKEVLPPSWLVHGCPAGVREVDVARRGPLVRRLRVQIARDTPQTMAAATFVALRKLGAELEEDSIGRLPSDRPRTTPSMLAGAQQDVRGKVVLLAEKVADAQPTADALTAILRVNSPVRAVGADDAFLVLIFAFGAGVAGFALRPRNALAAAAGLFVLALVGGFVISMQGRPILTVGAMLAVPLAALPLGLTRGAILLARRLALRRTLAQRTTRAVAIDLVAQPEHLVPLRRRVCVLVADLAERVGTNVGAPIDVVRAVEMHEQRVLDAVRHYAGIVDRFDGDRVVAIFFMEGDGSGTLLAAQAALEITRLSGGGGTAVGIDAGEALCGLFGVDRRFRVQGEVVRRAARAARVAASRNLGVAATEVVCRAIEPRFESRSIGKDSDLLLFEIVSERRREGGPMSDELTIPR